VRLCRRFDTAFQYTSSASNLGFRREIDPTIKPNDFDQSMIKDPCEPADKPT